MMTALLAAFVATQPAQWPLCEDVDLEMGRGADCVLTTTDAAGWFVAFDYSPDQDADSLTVIVTAADGIPVQTIDLDFEFAGGLTLPETRDVDGDGYDDIVVVDSPLGVVNGDFAILFGDFDGFWNSAMKPNGHTLSAIEPGLFYAQARSASWQQIGRFYTREGASLIERAVVSIEFDDENQSVCRLDRAIDDRGEEFYCNAALTN